MSYNWSLKICHNFDNFGGKLEPDSQLVSWLDVCYCRSTSPILWPGDEGPRDFLNPFLYVLLVKTSATFKPNIVGGRSPFCFPSLPLPNPFVPFCLSILSLLLSFPAPSPALEAGSVGVTPGKLFEILHCCRWVLAHFEICNKYWCHGDYWVSYQVTNQAHDGKILIYHQTTSTGHRITKNPLTHLGEMFGVGGFSLT